MKDQYKSYSAIQLAGEDAFIAWVIYGARSHEWEDWLVQHAQVQSAVEQARRIVYDMMHLQEYKLEGNEQLQLWQKIESEIALKTNPRSNQKPRLIQWISIAVAATIALVFWIGTRQQITTVLAQAGEQKEIQLPESSQIQLNAGSKISYDARHFTNDRALTLTGEAFFQVHPGSRFTVKTAQGSVTVLGTSFNVIAWPDRFEVTCYTGKVKVENQHQNQLTITPGQRCINDVKTQQLISSTFIIVSETPDWTKGKFVFENQPLKIVVGELERQYNIEVKLNPGLENIGYSGFFESGDLDKALSFITWPLHLKAEKKGNTVSIGR